MIDPVVADLARDRIPMATAPRVRRIDVRVSHMAPTAALGRGRRPTRHCRSRSCHPSKVASHLRGAACARRAEPGRGYPKWTQNGSPSCPTREPKYRRDSRVAPLTRYGDALTNQRFAEVGGVADLERVEADVERAARPRPDRADPRVSPRWLPSCECASSPALTTSG
jgi:hypothetical protein